MLSKFQTIAFDNRHRWQLADERIYGPPSQPYQIYICADCAITGRKYSPNTISVSRVYGHDNTVKCGNSFTIPTRVKIKKCLGGAAYYANLTIGSTHDVVKPPPAFTNDRSGVWVEGQGLKVRLLPSEYEAL